MNESRLSDMAQKLCKLCNTNDSKYCCPRCNILYCSLDCYKSEKHSQCSEDFYKDCISEELATYQTDNESRQKMIDILKKMQLDSFADQNEEELNEIQDDDDSDDEEYIDLQDRIKDLNLNDADTLWEALTEDERNEFEAMLSRGDVGMIMPQWEPWWMYSKEKKLVEDLKEKEEDEMLKKCPSLKSVPEISALTTVEPSPAIRYNIANVLASYAFIMRYFNGEIDPPEATVFFLKICDNLNMNANFDDLSLTVESVAQKCLQTDLIETDELSLNVMKRDTFLILQGPSEENQKYYCKAALSHLHNIFTEAKKTTKPKENEKTKVSSFSRKFPDHKTGDLPNLDIGKVKKCIKKLEYYLSYVENCTMYFE